MLLFFITSPTVELFYIFFPITSLCEILTPYVYCILVYLCGPQAIGMSKGLCPTGTHCCVLARVSPARVVARVLSQSRQWRHQSAPLTTSCPRGVRKVAIPTSFSTLYSYSPAAGYSFTWKGVHSVPLRRTKDLRLRKLIMFKWYF